MTIPNLITIARLITVPLIIVMIGQERWVGALNHVEAGQRCRERQSDA